MKNIFIIQALLMVLALSFSNRALSQDTPDRLIKGVTSEMINSAKEDKNIQANNPQTIQELVERKIAPYLSGVHMTAIALGRYWRSATPEQQRTLVREFSTLIIHTYANALNLNKASDVEVKPVKLGYGDTEVEVHSQINQNTGQPIKISYRFEKNPHGWYIYDISIDGEWLVEQYKSVFSAELRRNGIDGVIKSLIDKNQK